MDYAEICEIQGKILPRGMNLSPHFKVNELSCRHCGRLFVSPVLLHMLEWLRAELSTPITICSGYRCPDHNKAIGGSHHSAHCMGLAADIAVPVNYRTNPAEFVEACEGIARQVNGGYHFYPKGQFCHVDCRPFPPDRRW